MLLIHNSRESEIGDKQVGIVLWCSEQKVLWLQVPVHDTVVMEICDGRQCGSNQVTGIGFVVVAFATDAVKELAAKGKVGD